jgi:23S rRNA (pseudouridine1915-N3)-methyltransferase
MRILLMQVDKTQDSYLTEGTGIFEKRIKNYIQLEVVTINMPKAVRQRSIPEQKTEEGKVILGQLQDEDFLILLDEGGKDLSSREFAKLLMQKQNASLKRLVFLIGGPFGFSDAVYQRANYKLSLSKMTFSHQMVRLIFLEQLYRAYTIIKGEKYHHD